jgi:hypothetical protein
MSGDETYLGDGLYCRLNAFGQIELRAPRYDERTNKNIDHICCLEPAVYQALRRFAVSVGFELPLEGDEADLYVHAVDISTPICRRR